MATQGTDRQEMAARLREARESAGLTQADAATALGIPRSGVADIERGHRNVSSLELRSLARLYRRDIAWLAVAFDGADAATSDTELNEAIATLNDKDRRLVAQYARFLASQTAGGYET